MIEDQEDWSKKKTQKRRKHKKTHLELRRTLTMLQVSNQNPCYVVVITKSLSSQTSWVTMVHNLCPGALANCIRSMSNPVSLSFSWIIFDFQIFLCNRLPSSDVRWHSYLSCFLPRQTWSLLMLFANASTAMQILPLKRWVVLWFPVNGKRKKK